MIFLSTRLNDDKFYEFIKELSIISNSYFKIPLQNRNFYSPTSEHIIKILNSYSITIIFQNLDKSNCRLLVYIDKTIKVDLLISISAEVLIASVFMGTTLFDQLNKSNITEVDFINKKKTELQFIKVDNYWDIIIDIE